MHLIRGSCAGGGQLHVRAEADQAGDWDAGLCDLLGNACWRLFLGRVVRSDWSKNMSDYLTLCQWFIWIRFVSVTKLPSVPRFTIWEWSWVSRCIPLM